MSEHQSKLLPEDNKFHKGNPDGKHYWLTPPELMEQLQGEFNFDFDPCPFPLPEGFDGLTCDWGKSSYVNPPFGSIIHQGKKKGMTAWVRKAIVEQEKGKDIVIVFPVDKWLLMLVKAGAEIRNLGDVKWLATEDGSAGKGTGRHIAQFILKGKPMTKANAQTPELLPCPFCGANVAKLADDTVQHPIADCCMTGRSFYTKFWQTRATPPATQDDGMEKEAEKLAREIHNDGFSAGQYGRCAFPIGHIKAFADRILSLAERGRASRDGVCKTCNGFGMIGGIVGQTAETYDERSEPCPDCAHQSAQTIRDEALDEAIKIAEEDWIVGPITANKIRALKSKPKAETP